MEAARLRGTVALFRDYIPTTGGASVATIVDGSSTISVPAGRRVLVHLRAAGQDPAAFPDPQTVKLDRPIDSYIHYGFGPHQCIGKDASMTAMTTMFKTVFSLKNLRRVTGSGPNGSWYKGGESQGELKRVPGMIEGLSMCMTPDQSSYFPFPTTMKVQWDLE
jgi:cytochrome P450